eukprot:765978-Hanusia_phi.AAC.4
MTDALPQIPSAGVFAKPKGLTRMPLPNMAHPPPSSHQHAPSPSAEPQPEHAAESHMSSPRMKDPPAPSAGRAAQVQSGWAAGEGGRQDAPMPPAPVEQMERSKGKGPSDVLQQARDAKKTSEV